LGVARLLAKGWVLVCLFAGAHALRFALISGGAPLQVVPQVIICTLLFAAMGLLFIGGYGASSAIAMVRHPRWPHFIPGFNDAVFLIFVVLSFIDQVAVAPSYLTGIVIHALQSAMDFAIPAQHETVERLGGCALDGGRVFASAFTWLLTIIFVCSALSRVRLAAGLIRLERTTHPEMLGPVAHASVLGVAAVIAFQFIYVGTAFRLLPCSAYTNVSGALLIGLAPLLLGYLIVATLAVLLAASHEK
jgi:hypothetical protein